MTERGRSGRNRLGKRLVTAQHGALLLDRKDRILEGELQHLQHQEESARSEWERLALGASVWLIRAAALDGRARIAAAGPSESAEVVVTWSTSVGVTYPDEVMCAPPIASPAGGSSALSFAMTAHREAVTAAVRYAAVRRSILLITNELMATRVRRRAIENRWIPHLTAQLVDITRDLDAQELEDTLRMRWAGNASMRSGVSDDPAGNTRSVPER